MMFYDFVAGIKSSLVIFGLIILVKPSFPGENPDFVNLDIPASDIKTFETLRRIQSRSTSLYFSQNFPQRVKHTQEYLEKQIFSSYDGYFLSHFFPFGNRPLINFKDTVRQNSFFLSPLVHPQSQSELFKDSSYHSYTMGIGMRIFGTLKSNLVFYTRGHVFTQWTSERQFGHQYDPDEGETCSAEVTGDKMSNSRTCNRFEHYLLFDLPWLSLKAGRDNVHMGPGYFSSLTAQRQTAPYYLLEGRIDFSDWFFLDNYFLKMTDTRHEIKKYQHIHRFEFRPCKSLSIAFQDAVIYQERDIDVKYALPLSPLAFSEDNNGGRDNDAMSVDFLYSGIPYISFWGELFIDDLLGPTTFFDDFWENRWAVLAGFQAVSPWNAMDADLVMEYSRIEPWTYTGRQKYTSFKHFNLPSAGRMGPNSQSIDVQLSYRPAKYIELKEHISYSEKGTGDSTGSTLGVIHKDNIHGTKKEFLGRNININTTFTHQIRGHWNRFIAGEFAIVQEFGQGYDLLEFSSNLMLSW